MNRSRQASGARNLQKHVSMWQVPEYKTAMR
uniref:Uncharacterized protein n=1 Tax=Ackermannviridae sp. TaxID=2831612 RepID=A0A8S5VIN2_9CAUD|nr:MAG TPA: hypothetical protein [Ackermannviridae sp.]